MSCKRAREFLAHNEIAVKETVDAGKRRIPPEEALAIARAASELRVARGKKVVRIDMKRDAPDDDALLGLIIGNSGYLRAPTVRRGKTLLVGFSAEAYDDVLT
jgi:arsenate reductase-like glutaredoxin family protein